MPESPDADDSRREEEQARAELPLGSTPLFVQIVGAIAVALLAVIAAQSFFTARDVNQVSQGLGALAGRVLALDDKSRKLFDEVVVLRGQVGEMRNILQITSRQGGGAAGEAPPGPRDWTGVYVSELAPLLPILSRYQGDMGEAWIYTDNQAFIESIAEALENLEAGGVEVETEQAQ